MKGSILVDSNLAALLIVGSASRDYVSIHKRCKGYSLDDFDLVGEIIKEFSDIITVPHLLAETSNLVRDINGPAYRQVQAAAQQLVREAGHAAPTALQTLSRLLQVSIASSSTFLPS